MKSSNRNSILAVGLTLLLWVGVGLVTVCFLPSVAAQEEKETVAAPVEKPAAKNEAGKKSLTTRVAKEPASSESAQGTPSKEEGIPAPDVSREEEARLPRGKRVRIGVNQTIGANERVMEFVTVFGNAELDGETALDMVTAFGNAKMTGRVGHDMVTVFGNAQVNGPVNHDLVVVFGNLALGPNATVNHDCVVVFGTLDRDPRSVLRGQEIELMSWLSGIGDYFRSGPLLGRLLPPSSTLAWIVVAFNFVLYILIALIVPKPVAGGVKRLDENPFLSLGIGALIMLLLAPAMVILTTTVVGIILVPFVWIAIIVFGALGKASTLEFIGLQIMRRFRSDVESYPIIAFLIGFLIVTVLYMIPVIGLLVWVVLCPLALGAAVLAVFGNIKRSGNGSPVPGIPASAAPVPNVPPVQPPVNPHPDTGSLLQEGATVAASAAASGSGMVLMPRAGFWIRAAATVLDFILLVWLLIFTHHFFVLIWVAYHIAMWSWKGTTIGGIICRLKVVRVDGRPVDFGVALVRGLTAVFSAVALCLGFFWAGWTRSRQSWHDLISDTVIVRVPPTVPLI